MRLTLRTLLAYLDGNLEPQDADDIGKKIEESEFAANLVHRIRETTGRLRLGVPPLIGRGLGADPNTVAEYLEYRLGDDRVPELEKICLESDVHLAEVASCHQILTLVLDKAAEIDPAARQRLYELANYVDAPPVAADPIAPLMPAAGAAAVGAANHTPATGVVVPPMPRRARPEVPEYLREKRSRFWPVAAVVLICAALTFGGLLAFGPVELRERVLALVQSPADETDAKDAAETPEQPPADETPGEPVQDDQAMPPAASTTDAPATDADATDAPSADRDATEPAPAPAGGQDPATIATPEPRNEDPSAPAAPEPPEPGASAPAPEVDAPIGAAPLPGAGKAEMPDAPDAGADAADKPGEPDDGKVAPAGREGLGRFSSTKQEVLLKRDRDSGEWIRLAHMSPLRQGDQLLTTPAFRPAIDLTTNVKIQADGPSQFELIGWTPDGLPVISVDFGRLLMVTIGKPNNSLILRIDGQDVLLTFVDAESSLALEVRRELPPGKDPLAGPAPMVASLYATSGLIRVRLGEDNPVEMQSPSQRSLLAAQQPADAAFPAWVTTELVTKSDVMAVQALEPLMKADKPIKAALEEVLGDEQNSRRRENRWLATRILAYTGDFDPSVKALGEAKEKLFWPTCVDELRAAVARSPEAAAKVRTAFEQSRGQKDGATMFRTLWGYSNAELKDGAGQELVEMLDSESLDMRVLGIQTLVNLTGATHGYQANDGDAKRRQAYGVWKKQKIVKATPRPTAPATKGKLPKAN